MKQHSVFLIYNANAGKRRVSQELETIITELTKAGCLVTACPVLPEQTAVHVLEARAETFDAVVCCGGDGTLHYTVNEMLALPKKMPVGYLPYGSTNDFAASLGLKRSLAENCAAIGAFCPKALDTGRFNDKHFCYVAAFGMFTQVSYQTPQAKKNLLGHFAYVLEGVLHLDPSQRWNAAITVDDKTLEGEFWYGSVSNSRYIGGLAMPEQVDVQMDDGLFEVIIIRKPQNLLEMHRLASSLVSQKSDNELLYLMKGHKVQVKFEQPTSWTLDGEAGPTVQQVEIEAENKQLNLLM